MTADALPASILPIIDIAPYLPNSSASAAERAETAAALHAACRDFGFFYLRVSPFVGDAERGQLLDYGREFFALPQDEKDAIHTQANAGFGVRGYQRMRQNVTAGKADHHEGLDFFGPSPFPAGTVGPLAGENQWPARPEGMSAALKAWVEKMHVLGKATMRGMADGLGLTDAEWSELWDLCEDSFWSMRVIGYPPLPPGVDGKSCGEHKDYGCLTFLHADACPASLQVLSRSGGWINADMIPGCMVVNIGAMWERWTGGLWPATLHRVIHNGQTFRVSHPFFFEPAFHAPCKLLPAAVRRAKEEGREGELRDEGVIEYGQYLLGKVTTNFKYDDE
ncbi:hypothetical protein CspeluHIS016_0108590 [Cutaneotrichosporon spelunceum]|uniref:Fe2OG dioxygenase domain-containing protein n=1 Tax=Cutaneotrichosporon spelunceum TaxID=1672016 RepID=A0AAD3TPG0_9TREE|nr:hypothetical protein CspeluHIS016_0108590 [Cutaneotrichosporon spelunceum]